MGKPTRGHNDTWQWHHHNQSQKFWGGNKHPQNLTISFRMKNGIITIILFALNTIFHGGECYAIHFFTFGTFWNVTFCYI
jgi:hypothetical protein